MANSGRPILVKSLDRETGINRERQGVFQVWGYRTSGGKGGPYAMQTIAVIELPSGKIITAYPDQIQFLDAQGDPNGNQ